MKKVVIAIIVCTSLFLISCKEKTITTKYTIGCIGFDSGNYDPTDWTAVEAYFSSQVAYNKTVTFEGKSLPENDAQALQYYNDQIEKLDTAYVCSLIKGTDSFIYGIQTLNKDGSYKVIGALQFQHDGTSEPTF
jgi:hypothetical protein